MEPRNTAHPGTPRRALSGGLARTAEGAEPSGWYRVWFEQAPAPMALVSVEGGVLSGNARLRELLGYAAAEALPQTMRDITHPDDLAEQEAALARLAAGESEGETLTLEHRYVRRDGTARRAKLTLSLLRDDADAPACIGMVVEPAPVARRGRREREDGDTRASGADKLPDITDHQQLEQALRDANAQLTLASLEAGARARRLETIFATMTDALVSWDAEGRVVGANPTYRELCGTEARADYLGMCVGR